MFLPTYGLFDEERFVERGREVRAFDTPWGRAAMLVCEDAWHSMTATIAALDGAQIIFVCAAPPARGTVAEDATTFPGPASVSRWDRLIRDIADEHGVYRRAGESRRQRGRQAVSRRRRSSPDPKGEVRGRAPLWDEAISSVTRRSRRRHARARRHAAHRRPRDDDAASAREHRRQSCAGDADDARVRSARRASPDDGVAATRRRDASRASGAGFR